MRPETRNCNRAGSSTISGQRNSGQQGFSLFEMLVVLALLAVMASTSIPALGRIFNNMQFQQQTRRFSGILRYARLAAVSKGERVHVRLSEEEECVFLLTGAVNERRECGLHEEDVLTMDPGEIIFFPEGTATPALLTFEKEDRVRRIRLDLLTGMPRIEKSRVGQ